MEYDTSFLKRQDNQIDVFPVIAGRPLEDVIREKMMCPDSENLHCTSGYFSWLDYDTEIGIIEEVYGASWTKKKRLCYSKTFRNSGR